uniref:Integrase catalytic domain-containing protein n=1 Tax=Nicotiana tabacum TaxID=4097 RepID=A0A1S4DIN6_TOBAC|nr:uncharacterized protein LOC104108861 [Nicotiana tomentosiformis]XP_016513227.1 PREDICTED: uncharacterized protein LOC107830239 [Nicotiana tabacum]
MPKPRTSGTSTSKTIIFNSASVAIHEIGDGHRRTSATVSKKGPYQKIEEREVVNFLWENIICRFGIPKEIACDNKPQFIGAKVTKFFEDLKIKRITSSLYHPSANGQADSTNKTIVQNLKKRLEATKGRWPEELPGVLWAYRTTVKSSTGETLFSLVYGAEYLIPVEVGEPTLRYSHTNEESNSEAMLINLELLEGRRDLAHVRMTAQKQRMERYYNQRTNLRYFKVGDLVLRKVTQNTRELNADKLAFTWEGPYPISAITGKGSYELENHNGDKQGFLVRWRPQVYYKTTVIRPFDGKFSFGDDRVIFASLANSHREVKFDAEQRAYDHSGAQSTR